MLPRDVETSTTASVAGSVPAPRPEVLVRVLDGLRGLPAAQRAPHEPADGAVDAPAMPPLPRRRT